MSIFWAKRKSSDSCKKRLGNRSLQSNDAILWRCIWQNFVYRNGHFFIEKKNTETLQFLIRETISNKQEPSFRQCMYLTLCSLMFISHLGQGHGCSLCQGEGYYPCYYIILCSLRAAISTLQLRPSQ